MSNLKFITVYFFCSVLFLSCNQQKKDAAFLSDKNFDSLIVFARDQNADRSVRLRNADLAYELLDNTDSIIKNQFIDLAMAYNELGNEKKYLFLLERLYKESVMANDVEGIGESSYCIANYFYNEAKYDSAYFYFTRSEKSFLKTREKFAVAFYIKNIRANILTFKKDYVGAEKLSVEALKVAKREKFDLLVYNCYITLGNSLEGLENYDKAIEYYNKAIEASEFLKTDPQYLTLKAMPFNYIANVYQKKHEYSNALKVINTALDFTDYKLSNSTIYCYLINSLAYSKFKLGDDSAVLKFEETLKIGDSIKSVPIQITSKTYLGEYYLSKKDTAKANYFLKQAQSLAHGNSIFEDELKVLRLLAAANPRGRAYYSNRYIALNDSLQVVERATRDKFSRIEFETDEIKTERNSLTLEKKNLSLQRYVIGAISLLLIVIIILWFMNKSNKAKTRELLLKQDQQKANEEIYNLMLNQQQKIQEGKNIEKQRISLELHDGVMGKLSAVRLNLYASLYKARVIELENFASQIDEIQAVEEEIRNIAHDLSTNLFSDNSNFIAIVKELFAKIGNHSDIHFSLHVSDAVNWESLANPIKINLYRILQEALHNIEKYAEAKNVDITMTQTDSEKIMVVISDDGIGFDPKMTRNGIGINNMKIRIQELRGRLDIQSELNKGTKIVLIIPF